MTRNWGHRSQQVCCAIGIMDRVSDVCNMITVLEISRECCVLSTLSSLKLISGSVFELESENENVDRHPHDQTDRCTQNRWAPILYNLAQAMSYNSGFKSIGRSVESESRKHNIDGCVHAQSGQTDRHQFQKQPSPGGVLSLF